MKSGWWRNSRRASRFRCIPFSAAWATRRPRARAASTAHRRGLWRAISITRTSSPARRSTFPCTRPALSFEWAAGMAGHGHAGQGDGEVDITALETSLIGTFQFIVRKDMHLRWPRAETPTHYITMGLNDDLNACATLAVREMIDFLVTEKHLSRDDAYMLSSVAADLHITELVDGNKGVHMMLPKSIFVSGSSK